MLESHDLLVGSVCFVRGREVLFLLVAVQLALAEPFQPVLILLSRLISRLIEVVLVLGKRALVRGNYIVVADIKILLEVSLFFGNHMA